MATDLERLVVSLDANVTGLETKLKRAGVLVDGFARDADRKSKEAGKRIGDNLAGANDNKGLNLQQLQTLGHAARATFEGLAAGAPPLRILAQESVKASAAIGEGGLSGLLKSAGVTLAGVVSPLALAASGALALGAAAVYAGVSFEDAQQQIKSGLSGIGAASHATVADIEGIGEQIAATQKISVAAGRDIALAIARTGKVDVGNIGAVGALARGYANLTGSSLADAGTQLAGIFADPAKGAETLNAAIGSLDDRTLQYIQTLVRQGDRQKAVQALVAAAQPGLAKAAENTGLWAAAWDRVRAAASGAATAVGGAVDRVVSGPSIEDQAAALKRTIDGAQGRGLPSNLAAMPGFQNFQATQDPAAIEAAKQAYADLTAQIEAKNKAQQRDAAGKEAAALTTEAGAIVRSFDEAGVSIRNLEADLTALGKAIAASLANPDQQIEGGVAHAIESYDGLRAKLDQLKADYDAGGAAAAAALREASFAQQIAGASSFEKGLAEVNHQYDQLIRNARSAAEVRTLEQARQSAVTAYRTESGDRALSQVGLPADYAKIVRGAEGNNAAKNPNSSASGDGQFIDSTFIALYRKEYSDLAATMNDQAVLKLKSDFAVNERLIEAYGRENAVKLQNAGFQATAQNLYLAHNYGPQGAINLLGAAPGASATDILGQGVARANPAVAGHTAQQVIDEAARRSQRYGASGRAQQDAITGERALAEAYDKSAAEQARLESINQQLNADREHGGALGQQFATAQDLIAASSGKLTPALEQQRKEILALADARAKAAQGGLDARFQADLKEAYAALGRTADQQAVYDQAKTYAAPGSAEFAGISDQLTRLHGITEAKNDASDFVKGLVSDLIQGKSAAQALGDELLNIGEKIADKGIDALISGLFNGATGGGGFGLGKIFGFAAGGAIAGPGTGTSDSVPILASNGEFIVTAAQARKHRALLEAINSGRVPRFATGGPVGPAVHAAAGSPSPISVTHAPTYNVTPVQGVTPEQLAVVIDRNNRLFARQLPTLITTATKRFG